MAEGQTDVTAHLARAREREETHDWIGAAGSYEDALALAGSDVPLERGGILEAQGYSLFKAAMQADGPESFRSRIQKARDCYERAEASYASSSEPEIVPYQARAAAMTAFLGYWQATDAAEKKKHLSTAWQQAEEAIKIYKAKSNPIEQGKTYNRLALAAAIAYNMADNFEEEMALARSCVDAGEGAIVALSALHDAEGLAKAYMIACGFLTAIGRASGETSRSHAQERIAKTYWDQAIHSSETSALSEVTIPLLLAELPILFKKDEAEELLRKALEHGRRIHDRLLTGMALGDLAGRANWGTLTALDSDESDALSRKALEFAAEAAEELTKVSFRPPHSGGELWVCAHEASVYGVLAYGEMDTVRKRDFAERAVRGFPAALRLAGDCGYPFTAILIQHQFGYALASLAKTEPDRSAKKDLLKRAIELRKMSMAGSTSFLPRSDWDRGVDLTLLAEAEFELASALDDPDDKKNMLRDAVSRRKESFGYLVKSLATLSPESQDEILHSYPIVGHWLYQHSSWNEALYDLERDQGYLRAAQDALGRAAEAFTKGGIPSRSAECHWKAAQLHDRLGEYKHGAETFLLASRSFAAASEKTPRLKTLFDEYSHYMQGWAAIEHARHAHSMDDPSGASRHYQEAAESHAATNAWNYLSGVYLGLSCAEHAEDLSRQEKCREAVETFSRAATLFEDATKAIQNQVGRIESAEEAKMAAELMTESLEKVAFCKARVTLEEARILEMQGDLTGASEKYSLAARSFQEMIETPVSAENRGTLELILSLTNAWQAMARAESEASPAMYSKAAERFDQAKELAVSDRMKVMAAGNSHFCKALEAGAMFADTADLSLHSAATKHLESAARYYIRADLQNAAEYAKASKLLFDGYAYMDRASAEPDQGMKAKLYAVAEKVLQLSAASFAKAAQPRKQEQVSRLLKKVVEDRELAVALTDVLLAPDVTSTTMAFSSPTPVQQPAAGLDRFEHASVQVTLLAKPRELHVGQELSIEIELANAGRGPAQLTKVEHMFPEGFVVVREPDKFRVEDSEVNLKGRRLDALKTEDLKVVLKPTARGTFRLSPRVLYLDESGTEKTCEPAPVEVAVKEMGISGWLKGR